MVCFFGEGERGERGGGSRDRFAGIGWDGMGLDVVEGVVLGWSVVVAGSERWGLVRRMDRIGKSRT